MVSLSFRLSFVIFLCTAALACQSTPAQAQISSDPADISIYGGMAWNVDGSVIAVGTNQGVWLHNSHDLTQRQQLTDTQVVTALDINHQGDEIAVGFANGSIELWRFDTLQRTAVYEGNSRAIRDLDWSHDNLLLASSSDDLSIDIWNTQTDEHQSISLNTIGYTAYARVGWYPVAQRNELVVAFGGYLSIYSLYSDYSYNGPFLAFERFDWRYSIQAMSISPDASYIAGAITGNLKGIMAWDMEVDVVNQIPMRGQTGSTEWEGLGTTAIAWSPDSSRIGVQTRISYSNDADPQDVVQIWDIDTRELVHQFEPTIVRMDTEYANGIAWSPSGDRIASTSDDGHLYVWDAETFELLDEYDGYSRRPAGF